MTELRGHRPASAVRLSTESARSADEEYYRSLMETLPHGITEVDSSGHLVFCNRAFCELFRGTPADLLGKRFWELAPAEANPQVLADRFAHILAEQPIPTPRLLSGRTMDGRSIVLQVDWAYRRNPQGELIGFICGVADVTSQRQTELTLRRVQEDLEQRVRERTADLARTIAKLQAEIRERTHMEDALRESEQRFDLAVRGSTDGIWDIWDPPNGPLWFSPRCVELLGDKDRGSEVTPRQLLELVHPEERRRVHEVLRLHLERKSPFDVECRLWRKSGEYGWFRARGQAIWDDQNKPIRMAGSLQDITARKCAEAALRQQSRHLDAFFEHNLTPIAFLDREFNFLRVNTAFARVGQREVEEFPGRNHFDVYPSDENRTIFMEVMRTKKSFQVHAKPFVFPNHPEWGVVYWDWSLVPLLDNQGEVELLVFSLLDVTQRKRSELELQALNESLRQQTVQLRRMTSELVLAEQREHPLLLDDRTSIRVLLADDHKIFREGLASLLVEETDIEIVGQAADGQEALELARTLHPEVILMDITMPRLDGVGATRRITNELPQTCVIGLSMHDDELGSAILAAGATAYFSKHGPSEEILDAIRGCRAQG